MSQFTVEVDDLIKICEALAMIQRHTVLPIRIPAVSSITRDQAKGWLQTARLLRGDAVHINWDRIAAKMEDGATLPAASGDAFAVATTIPLVTSVGGVEVDLGRQMIHIAAARIDAEASSSENAKTVQLVPAADNTDTLTWVRPGTARDEEVAAGDLT